MRAVHGAPSRASDAAYGTGIGAGDSSRRPLTIVHVVSSLGVGGMERMLLQLASAQREGGHEVSVLAIRGGPLEREANERGLRVKVLGSQSGRLRRITDAVRYFRARRPDIVHVHNPTSLQYAVLSKLVSSPSVVVTLHGDQDTHARLGTPLEWRMTSAAVIVSQAAGRTLQLPDQAGPLVVVHNGISVPPVNAENRTSARLELQAEDACVGVMVARIDGRKGHRTLLESGRLLRNAAIPIRLWIVGDGSERGQLEALAVGMGVAPGMIRFLGRRSDIDRLLDAADFFVLPSDIEGLPMSILEAMAHGLPIVASRVGGVPEIIDDDENGLLIPAGDPIALADAIARLTGDAALRRRLGEAARARVATTFSLAAMVQRYEGVYADALARGTATPR